MLKHLDDLGGPIPTAITPPAGPWPAIRRLEWTKQIAGSYGGTRNPLVSLWPKRITAKGEVRPQWQHVIDIAPTILEAAGLPEPRVVDGTAQTPIEGASIVYSFDNPTARTRHTHAVFRDSRQSRHLP